VVVQSVEVTGSEISDLKFEISDFR